MTLTSFLTALLLTAGGVTPASLAPRVGDGPDGQAVAVARIVGAVIAYTRWPSSPIPLRLCIAGHSTLTGRFGAIDNIAGRPVQSVRLAGGSTRVVAECDALYLGTMSAADYLAYNRAAYGHAVLTLSEADADCTRGSMVCLTPETQTVRFALNVDAISRSKLRIDPRVLVMARPAPGGH